MNMKWPSLFLLISYGLKSTLPDISQSNIWHFCWFCGIVLGLFWLHVRALFVYFPWTRVAELLSRPLGWEGVDLAGSVTEGNGRGPTQASGMGRSLVMVVCTAWKTLLNLNIFSLQSKFEMNTHAVDISIRNMRRYTTWGHQPSSETSTSM